MTAQITAARADLSLRPSASACIRIFTLTIVGAAVLTLTACDSRRIEPAQANVADNYEAAADNLEMMADNTANGAEAAVLENQADALEAEGARKEEATDDAITANSADFSSHSEPPGSNVSDDPAREDAETVFCERLGDRATKQDCQYFSQVWDSLSTGSGAINFPQSMVRGETRTASFVIARDKNTSPESLLGGSPDTQFELKVARRMAAQMQGEGFAIDPSSITLRDFHIGKGVRWDWRITALKARKHSLTLSAYVVVNQPDGKGAEALMRSYSRDIPVTVTWAQKYEDLAETITSISVTTKAILAAIGVILIALVSFRKQVVIFLKAFLRK